MRHSASELVNSNSVNVTKQGAELKPRLELIRPEPDNDEPQLSPLREFDFSTPPWLVAPVEGFLDVDGILPVDALDQLGAHWESNSRNSRAQSEKTWRSYRDTLLRLKWFLRARGYAGCGEKEIYQFLEYCRIGHTFPEGRWGNPALTKPLSDRSIAMFYLNLRVFFNWSVRNKFLSVSPLERIETPSYKTPVIKPFAPDEIDALFDAAKRSDLPHRDRAILTFLYDTGIREDEFCRLEYDDINWKQCTAFIAHGKGDKERTVIFSPEAGDVVWEYLRHDKRPRPAEIFFSQKGTPLTTSGLYQLFQRLGEAARIKNTRCSPHTMRHTYASHAIQNGASQDEVRRQLGHTTDHMTKQYVELADKFRCERHQTYSPFARHVRDSQVVHRRGRPRRR